MLNYKLNINNFISRDIVSYETLHKQYNTLDKQTYIEILFNNLGYDSYPSKLDFIEKDISIDTVKRDIKIMPLDKKIKYPLYLFKGISFNHLCSIINTWIETDMERGYLLDPETSLLPLSKEEILYHYNTNYTFERKYNTEINMTYWQKSDLLTRRWHNLHPKIDKDYYQAAISSFNIFTRMTKIQDPFIIFISVLMNPDIFLSAIRNAEKEAFDTLLEACRANKIKQPLYYIYSNETNNFQIFLSILQRKIDHMKNLFVKYGYNGFLTQIKPIEKKYEIIELSNDMEIINTVKKSIEETPLDGDHKSYILQYIDKESMNFIDTLENTTQDILRVNTYKYLYYMITILKQYNPELLDRSKKFILSKPFFVKPDILALYSKEKNKFYFMNQDLVIREIESDELRFYYKYGLGINITYDGNEMGDIQSPKAVDDDPEYYTL